ncbi:AMP-binding protein [Virgisporangium aurantiacum]|uniref:Putative ligase n=1 Tax=Virgisporangium aurantiacum TaxID=175570 RepID=A0A8J4E9Q7_9ACTN|nr:AMP-binding protein [Virgisporangium aurantiacum]GIJ63987.1 putative ligase [Virgisporangium aurantiacum]
MRTIVDAIAGRAGGPGTLTVLDADGGEHAVGWSEVHHRARRVATVLGRRGIGPGARVGLLADTSIDLVTTLQAVWLVGAAVTVLPLPARRPDDAYLSRLSRVIADARLGLVVVGSPLTESALPLDASTSSVALSALVARARAAEPATPVVTSPADLAVLQYTSGSTREPRGVPVTHGHLAVNLSAIRVATRHERVHGCVVSWLPLYHDLGLIGCLALPMSCGCPLVLQSPAAFAARPIAWLEAVAAYRATATAAPNFAWELMARLLADRPGTDAAIDLGSLRLALTGAEPIDPVAMARFAAVAGRYGLDPSIVTCAYGLAEATLAVTVSAPGVGLQVDVVDPTSLETHGAAVPPSGGDTGRPLVRLGGPVPGARLRIVDRVSGRELGDRRVGRIEVTGSSVVGGYWGEESAGPAGWLRTGDLGYVTDGDLVVCGRESDLLFAAGRNVFPQDAEAAASTVPAVRAGNAVAFGVPGSRAGDRLVVAVESRAWADPAAADALRAAVTAAVVAEVGLTPRAVVVLAPGRLCKTSSGKLRRAEMRRRYLAGQLDPVRPTTAAEPTDRPLWTSTEVPR